MNPELSSRYPRASFVISSGNTLRDSEIATEFFAEVVQSLTKQKIPYKLNVQTGSVDLAIEVLKTVGEVITEVTNNQTFGNVAGSIASGIIASARNWFSRNKKDIKKAQVNKHWHAWEVIHTRVMQNLDGWTLSSIHMTEESMRLEFRNKKSREKKETIDTISDLDLVSGSVIMRNDDAQKVLGYCVKCKARRAMVDAARFTMKNGRSAIKGKCSVCGTPMFKIGTATKSQFPPIEWTTSVESTREKLLYSSGAELEWAVLNSLTLLDVNVGHSPDHSTDASIIFVGRSRYRVGFIEIKSSRDAISTNVLRQLHGVVKENTPDVDGKGILIVNQFFERPYPQSRRERMTLNHMQDDFARRQHICVIPTCLLYEALDNTKQALRGRALEKLIARTDGMLTNISEN